ncbi:MAG: HAD-IC family P-type ATPase, partial [Clostridium sp.]
MLFAAAGISVLLGEYSDAVIIMIVVAVNGIVGVVQEGKAQKALDSLKQMTRLKASVVRDGKEIEIDAKELVPGDLALLTAGCQVPADMRLIQSAGLKIEESALTGESVPVSKSADYLASESGNGSGKGKNMAYMTSYVTSGRGKGIVTATGMGTEIGRIAAMIHAAPEEETPLQKRLGELGKVLSLTAVALCAALFLMAVIQKRDVMEMLITAIS